MFEKQGLYLNVKTSDIFLFVSLISWCKGLVIV